MLRRLRVVMAEPITALERLEKIVVMVASNMMAEVCSVYILREDGMLELFATEGLDPAAIRVTTLKMGEGIVGTVAQEARALNLSDAREHPAFSYKSETGEEDYNSFLGVPILRGGRTLGVIAIQNKSFRSYLEEEIEALQTTSLLISEMIASGGLKSFENEATKLGLTRAMEISGVPLSNGVGLGTAVLHEPRIVVENLIAEDLNVELERLDKAVGELRLSLDSMLERSEVARGGEHREILESFRMFANDQGWVGKLHEAINNGLTAEAAVEKVQSDMRALMLRQTDPYLRERLHDFDDLANRLIRQLMGGQLGADSANLPTEAIIVARNMGAAELLDYNRERLRGLVLEEGGPTSHVAIVAKALGVPTVGLVEDATSYTENGDRIVLDGEQGLVHLRPAPELEASFVEKLQIQEKKYAEFKRLRTKPSVTKDGTKISIGINAGLMVDLPHLEETGAAGIGLFRTELQFMISSKLPRLQEQISFYRQVLDGSGGKPVVFRALDIGGDKVLPYLRVDQEENPAMGWRAIRLGLDRPGLLRTQLRALLGASAGRELQLMFPMVTEVDEFKRSCRMVEIELKHLNKFKHKTPKKISLGIMIEVPSVLFQLDELLCEVDFVSVGSNDLFQFFMAADRSNTRLSNRFDTLSTSFLRALKLIVEKADAQNVPVNLCGELAGKPLECMALLGLGYRSISMSPSSVGSIKAMILKLDLAKFKPGFLRRLDKLDDNNDMRSYLTKFAVENGIPVQ